MSTIEILLIIFQILNILVSLISPIFMAVSQFIKRIEKSSCCGSKVELHDAKSFNNSIKNENELNNIQIDKINDILEKISNENNNSEKTNSEKRNKKRKRHKSLH